MADIGEKALAEARLRNLMHELHSATGVGDVLAVLERLRALDVYALEHLGRLPHPLPMAFADAWGEVFDLLIETAGEARAPEPKKPLPPDAIVRSGGIIPYGTRDRS